MTGTELATDSTKALEREAGSTRHARLVKPSV